jgi:hypothetical protein
MDDEIKKQIEDALEFQKRVGPETARKIQLYVFALCGDVESLIEAGKIYLEQAGESPYVPPTKKEVQ